MRGHDGSRSCDRTYSPTTCTRLSLATIITKDPRALQVTPPCDGRDRRANVKSEFPHRVTG
jgi:hypothetical protein